MSGIDWDALPDVLAEHQALSQCVEGNRWVTRCECDEELDARIEFAWEAQAGHMAAVVRAWVEGQMRTEMRMVYRRDLNEDNGAICTRLVTEWKAKS